MALISIKRNVDLQPGLNAPAVFNCSQGDKGTTIMLGLMNGGNDYTVPSNITITIRGSRSNGAVFTPVSATSSGNTVSFTLTEEMTDTAGPTLCEAVLEQGNNVLGTANFIINVEGSPMGADVPPVFADAAWTWMLGKLTTETVPALGDDVISSIQGKVDKSQGSTNAKKFLRVNTSGNVSLASTDKTLSVADQIADAKETGDQIRALDAEIDGVATTLGGSISTLNGIATDLQSSKLSKNQGTSNAGKTMVVDSSGNIVPGDVPITIDDTLSIADAAADAKATGDAIALKANASTIAPEFSDQNNYTAGSYVYKNGVLYRFTSDHTGAWTGTDAETVTVGGEVEGVKADLDDAINTVSNMEDAVNILSNPQTVTGDSVTFSTDTEEPLKIECQIIPNQSGEGEPSPTNIRKINQISSITVSQSGTTTKSATITFPTEAGAVYGGELTINKDGSADFVANTKLYTLTGNEAWTYTGSAASRRIFYFKIGEARYAKKGTSTPLAKCSHFLTKELAATGTDAGYFVESDSLTAPKGTQIRIRGGQIDGAYIDTVANFKAWLAAQNSAGTPVQCTVELTEAVTYHLTAEVFKSAVGENTFSQDNGTVSITYNRYYSGLVLNDTQKAEVKTISVDRIPWEYAIDKVLCIGDSLTYGSPADSSTMPYPIEQNYPHYLSRFLRCECTNAGTPNYSAKSWYNNNYSRYTMSDYNAFIIFLGTNGGIADTLDTDVDPYQDYNDFADTQCGCYCKLIKHIQADRPNALIVLVSTWHVAVGQPETRTTIHKIGDMYGLPVVDTYGTMRYAVNPSYHGNVDNVHCSKAGYLALANLIRAKINDWAIDHPDFVNLGMSQGV